MIWTKNSAPQIAMIQWSFWTCSHNTSTDQLIDNDIHTDQLIDYDIHTDKLIDYDIQVLISFLVFVYNW